MGNQLTGIAPSQILPIEQYLTDIPEHEFDISLGSTRFFKVARSKNNEGFCVVKVFVIHDPSLPLQAHQDRLKDIGVRLEGTSNCLAFRNAIQTDRAALLFRQYLKDSLYDRISTRPFMNTIEKKWIAFQLLCALNQCHKLKVCHGDIKSENVMITSWNWLLLTDFASFKPTYLPEDNPSDFNYFFDTSRRRTCYIAPERFIECSADSQTKTTDITAYGQLLDLTTGQMKTGDLTPAMDIFSAGCVLTELFTEGTAPFDLSQLLAYRNGEYSPWKILERIEDTHIRELIRHMLQKDPACRLSAEDYLIQQRGRAFPEQFYTFLKLYLQRFATVPITPPDDRVMRLSKDLSHILHSLNADATRPDHNACLIIIITFVTACVRSLQYCSTKLTTLELLLRLAKYVPSDIILDRILPFVLHFVNDGFARVRAEALRTVTNCVAHLAAVPKSDATVFPEYILPQLSHLTQDPVPMVRVTYAENITQLAETALRVLEMTQLQGDNPELTGLTETSHPDTTFSYQALHYDVELQTLQELVQQKVVTLLSDPDNSVKQTLMEHGITRLCGFFGRQKANDVLLSHMITFLNDKNDWQLRGSFFDNIIGVASYVGWPSATILKPLLQQGLGDSEEYVVQKALCALSSLTQLSLIQKPLLYDFVRDVVPLLSHPSSWIRQGAVGFLAAVARVLNIADVHCRLLPQVQPFLKHTVLQLDKEVVLLGALREPVPRPIYDYVLRSNAAEALFAVLKERSHMRQISRHGHRPVYPEMDDTMTQLLRKLTSQGLQEQHEDKLLALKDFILKIHRVRSGTGDSLGSDREDNQTAGSLNLLLLGKSITRRHADLAKPSKEGSMATSIKKKKVPTATLR